MDEAEIIEAFRSGDERATAALYKQYGGLVFAVCLRVLDDRARAEDGVQQTFVQAWRSASSFDGTKPFGPWLATIARRVSIDLLRQDARHRNDSLQAQTLGGESFDRNDSALISLPPNAEQIETVWRVREAIDKLPPDDRELIRLQHFEGVGQNEIAERLGIPVGTVKSRGFRIQRQLAQALRSLRDDEPSANSNDTTTTQTNSEKGGPT